MARYVVATGAAILIGILLVPVLAYLWFGVLLVSASVIHAQGWDKASWWRPFGYHGLIVLDVLLGLFLLAADTLLCFRLQRAFAGKPGQWQEAEPESVKPPPAWGMNRQS